MYVETIFSKPYSDSDAILTASVPAKIEIVYAVVHAVDLGESEAFPLEKPGEAAESARVERAVRSQDLASSGTVGALLGLHAVGVERQQQNGEAILLLCTDDAGSGVSGTANHRLPRLTASCSIGEGSETEADQHQSELD